MTIPIEKELSNQIRFCYLPVEKFKTLTIHAYLHQDLTSEFASSTALLPAVLERGTQSYPNSLSLHREMENLYDAELSTEVGKKGERHLIAFSLELVRPDYLSNQEFFRGGLKLLKSVLGEPLIEEGGFSPSYVEQEKNQLYKEIRGIINDKARYAMEQCIQEMCRGERYRVFKYGDEENLKKITSQQLYHYYLELIKNNPLDVYMVGPANLNNPESFIEEVFDFPREPTGIAITPTEVYVKVNESPKFKEESFPALHQAKLVMGYRTNLDYNHTLFYPQLFFNGILGGFPHSKLFKVIREEFSLAYFVFSQLERHKGIMLMVAGIDSAQYQRVMELMKEQVAEIARGNITDTEMENTRRGLLNQLRVQEDNPGKLINFYLDAHVGGRKHTIEEAMDNLKRVDKEEVAQVAQKVVLDTIYLLRGEKGE